MASSLKRLVILLLPFLDMLLCPFVLIAGAVGRVFRRLNPEHLPLSRSCFRTVGIWPLRRHYYDPLFDARDLSYPLDKERALPGLDLNIAGQLEIISRMRYGAELRDCLGPSQSELGFSFQNGSFVSGDADYLYGFVRAFRPARVVEVGCGNSTKLIHAAIGANQKSDPGYRCEHACIEPFEAPWLDQLGVRVIRERVERLSMDTFRTLVAGDLLFIDSSHIIRPCGDVLFEILEVLPILNSGVYVHFHDIFTPRNYLPEWLEKRGYLWNEQYLLEAFLSQNPHFRVIASLNHLHHTHYSALAAVCAQHDAAFEPGSFYIQKC